MSLPFTLNPVALSLINEALEVHQALEAAGLPGVLPHRVSKNHVDKGGPAWGRMACLWALEQVTAEGMFCFALRERPRSRLFSAAPSAPREIRLTAVELSVSFPALCAEVARYQRGADVLDEGGSPLGSTERVLVQVQRQTQRLAQRLQRQALAGDTYHEEGLVRSRRGSDEDMLRGNLSTVPSWLRLPPELPPYMGVSLSSGRLEAVAERLGRDRLLYLPLLPLPAGPRDFGALELLVLTNSSDATEHRFDVGAYVRDEFKETACAAASVAVSWADLERELRESLDEFTAATRSFLERRLSAVCLLLREKETGRCLCATLGNISVQRYSRDGGTLQALNYAQTIAGLSHLAADLGLVGDDTHRFVYHLVTGRVSAEELARVSDQQVAGFWDDIAQRNTEALRVGSSREGAKQLHHIALAGVGGSRADYGAAWGMTRQLVDAFAAQHAARYPHGLSEAPFRRLSRSFMDVVSFTQPPTERLLMGSGAFNQLMDLLALEQYGLAALPLARKTLDRAEPMRCAEWMHMLHLQLPSREDMAAVVLDMPPDPPQSVPETTLYRGVSPRDSEILYQRRVYPLTASQADLQGTFILAPPEATDPVGVRIDLERLRLLLPAPPTSRWMGFATGSASTPTRTIEESTYIQQHAESLLGRSLGHRLSLSQPLSVASKLIAHLQRTLQPREDAPLPDLLAQAHPLESLLAGRQPGEVHPLIAQVVLWAALRLGMPADSDGLALRWVQRQGRRSLVVELSRGSEAHILSLSEAQPLQAAAFYASADEISPTPVFARLQRRDRAAVDANRERQRRVLLDLADRLPGRETPAIDTDTQRYLPVRIDKRGRLLLGGGRTLPNTANTTANARLLLAAPAPPSVPEPD